MPRDFIHASCPIQYLIITHFLPHKYPSLISQTNNSHTISHPCTLSIPIISILNLILLCINSMS
ncbi:hypothetical protein C2G38_2113975 [Gigaspora rosea]|uniref:Uncharacterized protein n=1 Tax=Gigaspora rosea TaxID=44941 RepID=A0A397UEY9_9GLOM|nr:hypothetical protein C2G38_2113975 [Gigaspora rosea]